MSTAAGGAPAVRGRWRGWAAWALLGLLPWWLAACRDGTPLPTVPLVAGSPLPTRAAVPVLTLEESLVATQAALLRGQVAEAQQAWAQAYRLAPQSGVVLREGARVALAAGDLATAETRAWEAIRAAPKDAMTWALLGTVLTRQGDPAAGQQALGIARELDPALASDLFADRWLAARRAGDPVTLAALAQEYALEHPAELLAAYYQAEALLAVGEARAALELLQLTMRRGEPSPAALWDVLGRAYLAVSAWYEAEGALQIAGDQFTRGDASLYLGSDTPVNDLNLNLARAYLGQGRCAEAEPILRRLSAARPELEPLVQQAHRCLTPVPTWTPWLPSSRGAMPPVTPHP